MTQSSEFDQNWKVFTWLWEHGGEIRDKLRELSRWVRRDGTQETPRPDILILGPGGVGKTTIARILCGHYDDSLTRYQESIIVERYPLSDDPDTEIVVPPGQEHRREATWNELLGDLVDGRFQGVVSTGCFGYHTLGDIDYRNHRLFHGRKRQFISDYLRDRREQEMRVLQTMVPALAASKNRLWLLTLVAKQDLWWTQRREVDAHYRTGAYGTELQTLLAKTDPRRFRHELAFASLLISNFETGRGVILARNTAGYDYRRQIESLGALLDTILALRNWEEAE